MTTVHAHRCIVWGTLWTLAFLAPLAFNQLIVGAYMLAISTGMYQP